MLLLVVLGGAESLGAKSVGSGPGVAPQIALGPTFGRAGGANCAPVLAIFGLGGTGGDLGLVLDVWAIWADGSNGGPNGWASLLTAPCDP